MGNVLDFLLERGFVDQVSDLEGLRTALEKRLTPPVHFDQTIS